MDRIILFFIFLFFLMGSCKNSEVEEIRMKLISENDKRIVNSIPIIDSSWNFNNIGNTYTWENPDLHKLLKLNLPVHGKKTILFQDSIITEEDIYYSGLKQISTLIDPPNKSEGYERLIVIYDPINKDRKAYSFYCPEYDSILFPTIKDAEKIIRNWGISGL